MGGYVAGQDPDLIWRCNYGQASLIISVRNFDQASFDESVKALQELFEGMA